MGGPVPLIHLGGPPREQGRTHGRALADPIARNVALYLHRFETEAELPPQEVLRRAALYGEAIARNAPAYFEEMAGISEGARIALDEVAMLSVRYELLYDRFTSLNGFPRGNRGPGAARRDGCTAFVVLPERSADGSLRLGQNWDWIPGVEAALLMRAAGGEPASLALTEAGIPGGKIGFNAFGLGLAINGLNSLSDDWSGLHRPFHARCREALLSRDLHAAVRALAGRPRACSTNYLLAQAPDLALDLETAPETECTIPCRTGFLVHTNHFLYPEALGIEEPAGSVHARTRERSARMTSLLASRERISAADLETFLRDHDGLPDSICAHPDPALPAAERYATLASIVMDLTAREMSFCAGSPCEGRFETIRLEG